jgi:hypothetical protein
MNWRLACLRGEGAACSAPPAATMAEDDAPPSAIDGSEASPSASEVRAALP